MFIQNFKKENKIQKPNLKIDIFPLPFESRVFWQAKASRMTWDPAELRPKWHESIAEREFKACLQFENPPSVLTLFKAEFRFYHSLWFRTAKNKD